MSAPPPLPIHRYYYLHNFWHALHWLQQRYSDVLSAPDRDFIAQLQQLPQHSQALLVRMLMRRGPWFRSSKLQYEEIPDTAQAAAPLQALGWLQTDAQMNVQALFALHTHAELRAIFGAEAAAPHRTKQAWLQHCLATQLPPRPYRQWHPNAHEAVWSLSEDITGLCTRLQLMFFGNLRQTWTEFVLADLGVFRYEQVPLDAASRAFACRADIDSYLAMQSSRDAALAGLAQNNAADTLTHIQALVECHNPNAWLHRRRAKLLMHVGQCCEKAQAYAAAQLAYAHSEHPGARQRHVRVLELQGAHAAALALAEAALQAPHSEDEQQKVQRMLARLRRRAGQRGVPAHNYSAPTITREVMSTQVCLPRPLGAVSVEHALRAHWHTPEAPVYYVENTLLSGLFGLLCWPAIFAPVQGAFFHPFQSAPADFAAPDFAVRRAPWWAACLAQLQDGSYRTTILQRFDDKHGLQNPLVVWPALSRPLLELALHCIPAQDLQHIFARMLEDPRQHRTGLPDLIRLWPAKQRYALVEVKAPGDKLQDHQTRWLHYLAKHGIDAQVCYVTWQAPVLSPSEAATCS